MEIQRIGIIGAGQMGNGIAHVCALAGYDVMMHDVKREKVDAAFEIISMNLSRQAARGKISDAEKDSAMKRITAASSLDDFSKVDFAIEAATEDESPHDTTTKQRPCHVAVRNRVPDELRARRLCGHLTLTRHRVASSR